MRKLWTYIKNLYVLVILFISNPYDIAERWFGLSYQPPPFLFWVLLGVAVCLAIYLTYRSLRRSFLYHRVAWEVYDNLCESFRKLSHTTDVKKRDKIQADIESQRGKLPDKKLDEIIRLFLDAEAEATKYGANPYSDAAQYDLSLTNERMRNHIQGKYGERKDARESNLQTM